MQPIQIPTGSENPEDRHLFFARLFSFTTPSIPAILIDGQWLQVHHHGSIDDPTLLARYQTAVRNNA